MRTDSHTSARYSLTFRSISGHPQLNFCHNEWQLPFSDRILKLFFLFFSFSSQQFTSTLHWFAFTRLTIPCDAFSDLIFDENEFWTLGVQRTLPQSMTMNGF